MTAKGYQDGVSACTVNVIPNKSLNHIIMDSSAHKQQCLVHTLKFCSVHMCVCGKRGWD